MDIFKKPCVLRSFGETIIERGYPKATYKDRIVKLNVQPLTSTEVLALPDGIRRSKNIKAFGKVAMKPADDQTGVMGDWIYYQTDGHWYECLGADTWNSTPIGQTEAVFGLVSNAAEKTMLLPPDMDAIRKAKAEKEGAESG